MAKEIGGKRNRRQKCWAAKKCFQLWVAKELGGKRVFSIVGGKELGGKNAGWQKCFAAKMLGGKRVFSIVSGKRAGRQNSVFYCGRQKSWAQK